MTENIYTRNKLFILMFGFVLIIVSSVLTTTVTHAATASGVGYYSLVTPSSYYVLPGNSVSFTGLGFAPNETVQIQWNGNNSGTVQSDSSGNISTGAMMIPYTASNAKITYTFTGESSGVSTSATIATVNVKPWVILSSYYETSGSNLTITGYDYGAGEVVTLMFNGTSVGTYIADQNGTVSASMAVPNLGSLHASSVTLSGASTGAVASAGFTQQY